MLRAVINFNICTICYVTCNFRVTGEAMISAAIVSFYLAV